MAMGYLQKQTPVQGAVGFASITTGALSVTGAASVGTTLSVTGATFGPVASLEAFATGGQADATALTSGAINIVTVCAAAGDSVKLPNVAAGSSVIVRNDGAKCLAVYPATDESIDGLAANAPYYVASGSTQHFAGDTATSWKALNKSLRFIDIGVASLGTQATLTMDNAYHDLDASATFPPSAIHGAFRISVADSAAGTWFQVADKANTRFIAMVAAPTSTGVTQYGIGYGPLGASRVIQYKANAVLDTLGLAAYGYWVEG